MNDIQVFLFIKFSFREFVLSFATGTSKVFPLDESLPSIPVLLLSLVQVILSVFVQHFIFLWKLIHINSFSSTDSDVFYVEQSSGEQNSQRHYTPDILNSTELSGIPATEHIIITNSLEQQIAAIDSNATNPTIFVRLGETRSFNPFSFNDLNLPPNPFNILATMVVVPPKVPQYNEWVGPQSPVPSELSSISTPSMTYSTVGKRERSSDAGTSHSNDEPRRILLLSGRFPPPPPGKQK